jgi:PAS domain S-box-containing protein
MSGDDEAASFRGDPPAAAQDSEMVDRRELALVAVERTRMPMVVSDPNQPDNPIILANHAFLDLTGYAADEVIGRNCRFLQGSDTEPDDVDRLREALARNDDHIELELLNYRKDGSTFWNQLGICAVRDANGKLLYHFASQKDVSNRRNAQALQANEHRLLMEVDHRAMNALALVQSIVSLTRADDDEGLLRAIRRRIDSLARAHRLLAAERWHGAGLHELLTTQMGEEAGEQVVLDGPPVWLAPHVVQPLALVLHELFSNAQRHGALLTDKGRVKLTWDRAEQSLQLRWDEKPVVVKNGAIIDNFGLEIVLHVIKGQLKGQLTRTLQDTRLAISIDIADVIQRSLG